MTTRVTYATKTPRPEKRSDYEDAALAWLEDTNSTLHIAFESTRVYFPDDDTTRDVYNVTLSRGKRSYSFTFANSVANSARWRIKRKSGWKYAFTKQPWMQRTDTNPERSQPGAYSILACMEKHNPGSFATFCEDFGWSQDSKNAETQYRACVDQYLALDDMYAHGELDQLREIQ